MVSVLCRIWPVLALPISFLSVLPPLTSFQPHDLLPVSRVYQVWSHLRAFASAVHPALRVLSPDIRVDLCGSSPPHLLIYSEATPSRRPAPISHTKVVPPYSPSSAPASFSHFPLYCVLGAHHSPKSLTVYFVLLTYCLCPLPDCKCCWQGSVLSC